MRTTKTTNNFVPLQIGGALRAARERLARAGSTSTHADSVRLLCSVIACESSWLLAHDTDELGPDALAHFDGLVTRREAGEPIAYIVGYAGFFGRTFAVGPAVLVPRPESEELIERAIVYLRSLAVEAPTLCDVGTGSGILAITAACEIPALRCTAIDISPQALDVARSNAVSLGVADRVTFVNGDLFGMLRRTARFDCIVANLPYVETAAIAAAPDPVSFEPRLALDGGSDGLDLYRRLFVDLERHVLPGATVFLEAGASSTASLSALAAAAFPRASIAVHHDYGGQSRMVAIAFP